MKINVYRVVFTAVLLFNFLDVCPVKSQESLLPEAQPRANRDVSDQALVNPLDMGAAGDYFLANGNVNPSPTDDTAALQAAIDATHGNGVVYITKAFYCTKTLQVSGILGIKSPLVPALYCKSKLGRARPFAVVNKACDLFRVNPDDAQSGIHMQGVTFIGNGSNKMLN